MSDVDDAGTGHGLDCCVYCVLRAVLAALCWMLVLGLGCGVDFNLVLLRWVRNYAVDSRLVSLFGSYWCLSKAMLVLVRVRCSVLGAGWSVLRCLVYDRIVCSVLTLFWSIRPALLMWVRREMRVVSSVLLLV